MMRIATFAALVLHALPLIAPAQTLDNVRYLDKARKEQSLRGNVDKESPVGVVVKQRNEATTIPAADIVQIEYATKVPAIDFRLPFGKEARALAPGTSAATRQTLLQEALDGYRALAAQLNDHARAKRYLTYKIAEVQAHQAATDPKKADAAIAALSAFKDAHADGWQIVACLKLLARMQEEKGEIGAAQKSYEALAGLAGLPAEQKRESDFLVARLLMRSGKFSEAQAKLQALAGAFSATDPQRPELLVLLSQAQIEQGNLAAVEKQLKDAVGSTTDPAVKAAAHNALGDLFLKQNKPEDAFWEYLRVDVLYNADREQQAKALYHLSKLFDKVKNDPLRADACKERLLDKSFAGAEFAKKAAAEK